jgi:hypothetical protein
MSADLEQRQFILTSPSSEHESIHSPITSTVLILEGSSLALSSGAGPSVGHAVPPYSMSVCDEMKGYLTGNSDSSEVLRASVAWWQVIHIFHIFQDTNN